MKKVDRMSEREEIEYVKWRFRYWVAKGDMNYLEIDEAVNNGEIQAGDMSEEAPKEETP